MADPVRPDVMLEGEGLGVVLAQLDRLERRLSRVDRQLQDQQDAAVGARLEQLAERLAQLERLLEAPPASTAPDLAPVTSAVADGLSELRAAVIASRRSLADGLDELRAAVAQAIATRPVPATTAAASGELASTCGASEIQAKLDALARRLEGLAARPVVTPELVQALDRRAEQSEERLGARTQSVLDDLGKLRRNLIELLTTIDGRERLDGLAASLDGLATTLRDIEAAIATSDTADERRHDEVGETLRDVHAAITTTGDADQRRHDELAEAVARMREALEARHAAAAAALDDARGQLAGDIASSRDALADELSAVRTAAADAVAQATTDLRAATETAAAGAVEATRREAEAMRGLLDALADRIATQLDELAAAGDARGAQRDQRFDAVDAAVAGVTADVDAVRLLAAQASRATDLTRLAQGLADTSRDVAAVRAAAEAIGTVVDRLQGLPDAMRAELTMLAPTAELEAVHRRLEELAVAVAELAAARPALGQLASSVTDAVRKRRERH